MAQTRELRRTGTISPEVPRAGVALAVLAVWMLRVSAALLLASPLLLLALLLA